MSTEVTTGPSEGKSYSILHQIFRIGILLKGLNAFCEVVGGIALLYFSTSAIQEWITRLVTPILGKHPDSFLANLGLTFSSSITPKGQAFAAWYLLSHGIIKLMVVFCLVRGWFWAYPVAIVVFVGFMIFQTWEYVMGSHSWTYIALDIFDGFIIWLTVNEWRHARHHAGKATL